MNFLTSEQLPNDPDRLPPARRRRAKRLLAPLDQDERADFLDELAHRASPSFDFFFLSLISGILMSLGLMLDTLALLVLGAALAPLMAPAVGISLGTVIGSSRLFLRSLGGLLLGCLIVFLAGWGGGLLGQNLPENPHYLAVLHSQISWPNFLVLAVSAILATAFLVRGDGYPGRLISAFPNVALAYQLFLPLAAAGFGFGSGIPHLFPDGLVVFALHLSWSALLGAITLVLMGFRPLTLFGYTLGGAVTLVGMLLLIGLVGAGAVAGTGMGLPTPTPSLTPTLTLTPTFTSTPVPPTATLTATITPSITPSQTPTQTPTPTPVLAVVQAGGSEGVRIRLLPGGETIGFLADNALVVILQETAELDGVAWIKIQAGDGTQGWILQSLLQQVTATPSAP